MKRLILVMLVALALITGCKKKDETAQSTAPANIITNNADIKAIIGVSKIIAHPALDAIELGLQDELKEQGFTGLAFDLQSANGEISTAASIANKFRSQKVAVAVGIATPMALSLANIMKDTPIVFSAVTDPIDAGLRRDNNIEVTNITGVSDMTPVREQIELIVHIKPVNVLGHIYNAGEANSIVLLHQLEEICNEMGITLVATTVNNTSEVKQATEMLGSKKVDAIYVSTDNVVAAAIGSVTTTAAKYKTPVIGADPVTSAGSGAIAAYGVDYYVAGRETGKMIAEILTGTNPGDIPVKFMTSPAELKLYINEEAAVNLGITLSADLIEQAKR